MTGILQLLLGRSSAAPGYQIQRSLRFNSADSANLTRTFSTNGTNLKIRTLSFWIKRAQLGVSECIFQCYNGSSSYSNGIEFTTGDKFYFSFGGATAVDLTTTQVFRDPSAWYHIVISIDTTQATSSDRVKIYVNGSQVTAFDTANYPSQNSDSQWAYGNANNKIGSNWINTQYMNMYLTEMYFIDGQALTPSSFGETNADTGVWQPKAYTGTYGTNGFQLLFADNSGNTSTTLGKDTSGNGNNWTPNNFSVTAGVGNDSLVDTPTPYGTDTGVGGEVRGNYCTMNPLTTTAGTYTQGNLRYVGAGGWRRSSATIPLTTGKWYWEVTLGNSPYTPRASSTAYNAMGFCLSSTFNSTEPFTVQADALLLADNGYYKNFSGSATDTGTAFSSGDVLAVAVDLDANTFTFYRNNSSVGSGTIGGTAGRELTPCILSYSDTYGVMDCNFGQRPFAYTAPSGYKALCTQNLPTPTVGATSTTQAGKYFNTVLWTGNGASPRSITGVGFQPDFVWIKNRSDAYFHTLYDAVRGVGSRAVYSSSTDEENGGSSNYSSLYGYLSSFDSDGFGLTSGTDDIWTNDNTKNYVAWNWKANGAGSTNTAGTITATVSANTTSGISVVTYSISSASSTISTFGHGLGVAPSMVLLKVRNAVDGWTVYHSSISNPNSNWLVLNTDAAAGGNTSTFSQSSTTFGVRETRLVGSGGSGNVIAYCFAPIAGYSAFGSFVANGSSDNAFIYTGFQPRFVMWKRSDGVNGWGVVDTARGTTNAIGPYLLANASGAEATATLVDILSNGFKMRNSGFGNGETYIYMAFAEFPFKYTLAR